jgi:hypothetical protein
MSYSMDECALSFDGVTISAQKETVRLFYKELWDDSDKSLIPTIFHPDFTFRGSLGPTLIGYEQFAGYIDWVTNSFGHYTTVADCRFLGSSQASSVLGRCKEVIPP